MAGGAFSGRHARGERAGLSSSAHHQSLKEPAANQPKQDAALQIAAVRAAPVRAATRDVDASFAIWPRSHGPIAAGLGAGKTLSALDAFQPAQEQSDVLR